MMSFTSKRIFFAVLLASVLLIRAEADAALRSPFERQVERAVEAYSGANPVPEASENIRYLGGITPHHYIALAMIVRFYERIASPSVKRVWLFSPDHFRKARKFAAYCDSDWATAAITLAPDKGALENLAELKIAEANADLFKGEHGITLHIPLAARYFPNATVVPMVLNAKITDMGLLILRKKILSLIRDGDIIILSMDLSHYKSPEGLAAEDAKTLDALENLRYADTHALDVDARRAASLVLRLFKDLGATRGEVLEHSDSSNILGRRIDSGTSYATVVYGMGYR